MKPIDIVIILILLCVIGAVAFYIIRAKKRGQKCIGCPYSKECGGRCAKNKKAED